MTSTTLSRHQTPRGDGLQTWASRWRVFGTANSAGVDPKGLSVWQVLLVSSSRHPDQWIVPGGGMEPEEEPCGAAVREVYEEASSSTEKPHGAVRQHHLKTRP